MQQSILEYREQNEKLQKAIVEKLGKVKGNEILGETASASSNSATLGDLHQQHILQDPDFNLIKSLQEAKLNFVISSSLLPDYPLLYVSAGFLAVTGYTSEQVIGRNCRFLQGPETDVIAVARMSKAIKEERDIIVCLLNYKADGTKFWSQVSRLFC